MDTNGDSNMDTANGGSTVTGVNAMASVVASAASLTLVKVERPDHLAGTSTSPATVATVSTGSISTGSGIFATIANNNKTTRSDDWLATNSPGSPSNSLQNQHVVYTQQQLSEQQQPPIAHSSPLAHQQQQVSNNGYASPMSTSSYDPYSPNGKIGRDELSQPSSLNGYGSNSGGGGNGGGNGNGNCNSNNNGSSNGGGNGSSGSGGNGNAGGGGGSSNSEGCDAKKKKGPTPRQQEELCLVCGDRASGYHYNALTCEGCKGFFRRSITRNAVYQCKYGNNCEIDMYMRRKCQECRLKKCLTVGMRPECVVPEYQCAVKRKEKKAQKEKDKPNSTTMNGSPGSAGIGDQMSVKIEPAEAESLSRSGSSGILTPVSPYACVKPPTPTPISPEQDELINRLVSFQCEFEQPSEDDLKRITNQPMEGEDPSDYSFRHITEITILTVQLIVEFSKRLPGFNELMREDQITLLKACSSEVMMLRMARKYDVQTDSIIFANNQPYTRDSYNVAGMGETIEDLLRFCRQMYAMRVNNAEYALLTAIVIFSERPNLVESKKVEKLQEIYLKTLKAYVDNRRRPKSGTIFAKLLSVLTELRTLGNQNSEMCLNLKFKNKKLPVFLAEIWDVVP
ncbi:PREDICTED: ecdysone receptor isoform X1 [Dinoponera quadriceps]|uniref:Ecdysone receptor n=1 Tax=Dinoponera quadriceps TaxID=609295 RepID=A0A6P3XJT2_DINQU|nr:PREDICTED: ecdysone receptor isoform X1 [Dinoponera quadriceps]XP_014478249.1 PREDICTED: ecdysone receptor isoform X1 [Dinoponera quadriceps]XP_014478250.1 PREDICTED: ecdysone receptor isoform X1 [Dinoponera quadriceps]XP_014478251.1 PREDICTED: ecdysone receptor isoform X1 [Dinoponera quadriceps]XP_014478252.1 PREDICTED: ecdysone receptor isoform X1 [Dinoponera quadriceps]XP_014478253.1 PREDICTED: ecdysone receptor isoform X1 [Dinoponera quadriceps]XP_014478254.1 PREDICTED: ecdysone recept